MGAAVSAWKLEGNFGEPALGYDALAMAAFRVDGAARAAVVRRKRVVQVAGGRAPPRFVDECFWWAAPKRVSDQRAVDLDAAVSGVGAVIADPIPTETVEAIRAWRRD